MLFNPKHEDRLGRLADELRLAQAVTPDLLSAVISEACVRLPTMRAARRAARIERLIEAGAWTDAALCLVELEMPAWTLRRLAFDDGEWLCSLSKQPYVPIELDDTAEASHPVAALAILTAFVEARRSIAATHERPAASVPQVLRGAPAAAVCCDNFA
jgi:hypothetical protein